MPREGTAAGASRKRAWVSKGIESRRRCGVLEAWKDMEWEYGRMQRGGIIAVS